MKLCKLQSLSRQAHEFNQTLFQQAQEGGDLARVLVVLPQIQKYQRIYEELDRFFEDWESLIYRAYKKVIPAIQGVRGDSRVQRVLHSLKLRVISEQHRGVASLNETEVTPL